jgi:hypothetical protein
MLLLAATSSLVVAAGARATSSEGVPDYEVKAEFIERFTRFIDWPDSSFVSPGAPFVVCTWGAGPLVERLEHILASRSLKSRPVRLRRVSAKDSFVPCHILYVAPLEHDAAREISARTYGKAILSIGDHPGLAQDGLLLNLVVDDDGFVRFEINRDVARASGLRISAKLMRLARFVERAR